MSPLIRFDEQPAYVDINVDYVVPAATILDIVRSTKNVEARMKKLREAVEATGFRYHTNYRFHTSFDQDRNFHIRHMDEYPRGNK